MSMVSVLVVGAFVFIVKRAIDLALENEYTSWAPALARLWVWCAGFICRSHRDAWRADLRYQQAVEGNSGLAEASSCLFSAIPLALRDTASRARRRAVAAKFFVDPNVTFWVHSYRPIAALGLSSRTHQILRDHRISTVDQLLSMREEELLRMRNFGRAALDEVKEKVVEKGFIQPS